MSETLALPDSESLRQVPMEPNRAPLALAAGLLSVFLIIPVGLFELGLSGNAIILGPTSDPAPLILRVLVLLPFWACVLATFFFTFTNRRETAGAMISLVVGCLGALISILCGFGLTEFALFPQG